MTYTVACYMIQLTFGCRGMSWVHSILDARQLVHLLGCVSALSPGGMVHIRIPMSRDNGRTFDYVGAMSSSIDI